MSDDQPYGGQSRKGFSLVEVLCATAIALLVLGGALGVYINMVRNWHAVNFRMGADREVNNAMSRMVYGMGDRFGLRAATGVTLTTSGGGWTVTYETAAAPPQVNSFTYSAATSNLVFNPGARIAGRDISFARVVPRAQSLVVTLRVDRVSGRLHARREVGTEISWRNRN